MDAYRQDEIRCQRSPENNVSQALETSILNLEKKLCFNASDSSLS